MGLRVSDRARASGLRGAHAGSVLLRGPAEEAGARASGEASQGAGRWARLDEERASDADSGGSGSGRARSWARARAEGGGADRAECWAAACRVGLGLVSSFPISFLFSISFFFFLSTQNYLNSNSDLNSKP